MNHSLNYTDATPEVLGEKGYDLVETIEERKDSGALDSLYTKVFTFPKTWTDGVGQKTARRISDAGWLLDELDCLSLADGYVLDAYEMGDSYGSNTRLYVRRADARVQYRPDLEKRKERERRLFMSAAEREKDGPFVDYVAPYDESMYISGLVDLEESKRIPEIWGYFTIPFTPMGIWQACLLKRVYVWMPAKWHGGYNNNSTVFFRDSVKSLLDTDGFVKLTPEQRAFIERSLHTDELLPHVEIGVDNAIVTYVVWSRWGGLQRRILDVKRKGKTLSFGEERSETLVHYDCGIRL